MKHETAMERLYEARERIAELEAGNANLREALKGVLPILDAVRYTVGLRGNQLTRIEKARAALSQEEKHVRDAE